MTIFAAGSSVADVLADVAVAANVTAAQKYAGVAEAARVGPNNAGADNMYLFAPAPQMELWCGFHVYSSATALTNTSNEGLIFRGPTNEPLIKIVVSATLTAAYYWTGTGWAMLGTASTLGSALLALCRIDVHVLLATAGLIEIFLNDALIYSYAGDTLVGAGAAGGMSVVRFGNANTAQSNATTSFSGWVLANENTRNLFVGQVLPNAAGAVSGWTGAYTTVDEIGYDDTDFAFTNTVGAVSTFGLPDFYTVFATGHEVKAVVIGGRGAASIGHEIEAVARVGGVNYYADFIDGLQMRGYSHQFPVSPATGVAWTIAEVNALEIGVRLVAA